MQRVFRPEHPPAGSNLKIGPEKWTERVPAELLWGSKGKPGMQARASPYIMGQHRGDAGMVRLVVRVVLTFVGTMVVKLTFRKRK